MARTRHDIATLTLGNVADAETQQWHPVLDTYARGVELMRALPTEHPGFPGSALCPSGGGYRAMALDLGVLWRLNDAGLLGGLKRVSSASGGSITAGSREELVRPGVSRRRPAGVP